LNVNKSLRHKSQRAFLPFRLHKSSSSWRTSTRSIRKERSCHGYHDNEKCYYESSTIFVFSGAWAKVEDSYFSWLLNSLLEWKGLRSLSSENSLHMKIGNEEKKDLNYEFMIWMNSGREIERVWVALEWMSKGSSSLPLGSTYCHQKFIMAKSFPIHVRLILVQSNGKNWGFHRLRFPFDYPHCTIIWTNFLRTLSRMLTFTSSTIILRGMTVIKFNENRIKTKTHSHPGRDRGEIRWKFHEKRFPSLMILIKISASYNQIPAFPQVVVILLLNALNKFLNENVFNLKFS
jgi:hypothetical protein